MSDSGATHVVHVINRLDVGGLENGVVNLINRLPGERFRHTIVCLSGYDEDFRRRIRTQGVEVLSLGKKPGKDPAAYLRMCRVLRRLRPDVVHTRNFGTVDMQWVAALAGVPRRIHGEHGWEASDPKGQNPRYLALRRLCRPVIHVFVPMSKDLARWLQASVGVSPRKIQQLYSGVDTERFCRSPGRPGSDEIVIGTVGRLDAVKNHEELIAAFRRLLGELPDIAPRLRLVIAGDGPLRQRLQELARDAGIGDRVVFSGVAKDVPSVLRSLDVFALPSVNEGISNTILEAMASSLPVVAARVGGNPELVENGRTGTLYDPAAPDSLADALKPYLLDAGLRHAHGAAGRDRVERHFSLGTMVSRYEALYRTSPARPGDGAETPVHGHMR
jgi:sugar transferase (PEP-CTERM/EpsH1 system associated)